MAELQENITLKKIEAPSLTQTGYGKNIREQFENIDDNFTRLSNADFVSGRDGSDIKFAKYELYDGVFLTDLGKSFIECIVGESIDWENDWDGADFVSDWYESHPIFKSVTRVYTESGQEVSSTYRFFDYIKTNPGISIMYQLIDPEAPDEIENRHLLCSPYVYLFIDERYAALRDFNPADATYKTITDASCVLNLVFHNEQPVITRINQFPTLYYDENDGQFKWKLYGNKTGILAAGPRGLSASSTPVFFAIFKESTNTTTSGTGTLTHILQISDNISQWVSIEDLSTDELPKLGDPIFAFEQSQSINATPTDPADPYSYIPQDLYFTRVTFVNENTKLIQISTGKSLGLHFQFNNDTFATMMSNTRVGGMGTRCIYIPIVSDSGTESLESDTPIHAVYAVHDNDQYDVNVRPIPFVKKFSKSSEIGLGSRNPKISNRYNLNIYYDKIRLGGIAPGDDSGPIGVEVPVVEIDTVKNASKSSTVNIYGELKIDKLQFPTGASISEIAPKISIPEGTITSNTIKSTYINVPSSQSSGDILTTLDKTGVKIYGSSNSPVTTLNGDGVTSNKLTLKNDLIFSNQRIDNQQRWHRILVDGTTSKPAQNKSTEVAIQTNIVSIFDNSNSDFDKDNSSKLRLRGDLFVEGSTQLNYGTDFSTVLYGVSQLDSASGKIGLNGSTLCCMDFYGQNNTWTGKQVVGLVRSNAVYTNRDNDLTTHEEYTHTIVSSDPDVRYNPNVDNETSGIIGAYLDLVVSGSRYGENSNTTGIRIQQTGSYSGSTGLVKEKLVKVYPELEVDGDMHITGIMKSFTMGENQMIHHSGIKNYSRQDGDYISAIKGTHFIYTSGSGEVSLYFSGSNWKPGDVCYLYTGATTRICKSGKTASNPYDNYYGLTKGRFYMLFATDFEGVSKCTGTLQLSVRKMAYVQLNIID